MSVTTIEWTKRPGTVGETWNPTTGCNKVDRGCKHCYAEVMHRRLQAMGQVKYQQAFLEGAVEHPDTLEIPLTWQKPRTVFVNSMSDLFHEKITLQFQSQVFEVMRKTPQHTYLILTKRPERAVRFWTLQGNHWHCPPNVWMGTSANDQKSGDLRIPKLLELKGCLRFLSYEPATGPLDLRNVGTDESWSLDTLAGVGYADGNYYRDEPRLHWVIMGGESGPKADPMHPAWVRKVRDDCKATGTPFFFKQWGAWKPHLFYTQEQEITIKFNLGKNEFLFPDPVQNMIRVGKGIAGNEIDGETWQQFPKA